MNQSEKYIASQIGLHTYLKRVFGWAFFGAMIIAGVTYAYPVLVVSNSMLNDITNHTAFVCFLLIAFLANLVLLGLAVCGRISSF